MAPERDIGDLVARFRLLVDESGTKEATLALDRLEKRANAKMDGAGKSAGGAFAGAFSGALVGQGILTGVELLGRGAAASLQAFMKAGEAGTLDPEAQQSYLELDNALTEATESVQDLALTVGEELAPALTEAAQLATGLGGPLATTFKVFLAPVTLASKALNHFTGDADEAAGAAKRNAKAAEATAKQHDKLNQILSDSERRFRSLVDAQVDEIEAGLRAEGSALSLADAQASLVEAQNKVAEASTRGAEFSEKEADALDAVTDAQHALTDARFRATRAADDLNEAQEALTEAQFRFGPQSKEAGEAADSLQEAQHALDEANHDVGESAEDVSKRQADYQQALRDGKPTVEALDQANRNLAKAHLAVKEAQVAAVTAAVDYKEKQLAADGVTVTAVQHAKDLEQALRNYGAFASSPEFAAQMAAGAGAIGQIRGGSPIAGNDGGRSFDQALNTAIAGTTINVGPIYANDPLAAAQLISQEIDWASRGGGGVTVKR